MLLFIEKQRQQSRQRDSNFKTSHVIVYLKSRHCRTLRSRYFKTSHVIVYLGHAVKLCADSRISKHLMLLFIALTTPVTHAFPCISKHLMLLFIPRISAFFSFSPPLFPLIFSIFLHFLPANTLILDRPTYHPINLLIFQAFLDFSFFFRLVKIL